jgi:hypothetical protein
MFADAEVTLVQGLGFGVLGFGVWHVRRCRGETTRATKDEGLGRGVEGRGSRSRERGSAPWEAHHLRHRPQCKNEPPFLASMVGALVAACRAHSEVALHAGHNWGACR